MTPPITELWYRRCLLFFFGIPCIHNGRPRLSVSVFSLPIVPSMDGLLQPHHVTQNCTEIRLSDSKTGMWFMSCRLDVDRANLFCRKNSWMIKAFRTAGWEKGTLWCKNHERPSGSIRIWMVWASWRPGCLKKSGRVMAVKHKRVPDIDLPPNNRMS